MCIWSAFFQRMSRICPCVKTICGCCFLIRFHVCTCVQSVVSFCHDVSNICTCVYQAVGVIFSCCIKHVHLCVPGCVCHFLMMYQICVLVCTRLWVSFSYIVSNTIEGPE